MKNPLHYQLSEYDCGPTSLFNAHFQINIDRKGGAAYNKVV